MRPRTRFRRYRGRQLPFSCFARPNTFSAVRRVSGPVFMFCAPGLIFGGTEGVRSVFMFCAPGLIFGDTEGVRSDFRVLRARTRFRLYRRRWLPFACFALPDSFSAIPRASGPVFMFCALGLVFGDTEGIESHFHVLRSRTRFRLYRGRRVPFSCFALLDMFLAVRRASSPVFMFCAPGLVFGCTEGVGSCFHVLCARTHFRRCGGRRVPLSCFALLNSFSAVRRASGPVLMFFAPDSFSAVPRPFDPVFMFCAPGLILGGT
jgi:hypothetical protein